MPFTDVLMQDMKDAMRARDAAKLGVIRFLLAQIKNVEIDSGPQTDEQIHSIVRKQIKQMKEAIADYERAARTDLITEENQKIAILEKYLPQSMSRDELVTIVEKVLAENPGIQLGQAIGLVKQQTQGTAEGGEIAAIVKEKL